MLKYFSENVTVAGSEKLSRQSKVSVSLWALILILVTVFGGYHIHDRVSYYLKMPLTVDIYTEDHTEEGLEFPAVTLCLANDGTKGSCAAALVNLGFQPNLPESCPTFNYSNPSWLLRAVKEYLQFDADVTRQTLDCYDERRPCNMSDFQPAFLKTGPKMCYTYRNSRRPRVNSFGYKFNFLLTLNIQTDLYATSTPEEGLLVLLHAPDVVASFRQAPILASAGVHTSVTIRRKKVQRLSSPYRSRCINTKDGKRYQKVSCIQNCTMSRVLLLCDCYLQWENGTELNHTKPVCNNFGAGRCIELMSNAWTQNFGACTKLCPEECTSISYPVTSFSFMRLHSNHWAENVGMNKSDVLKNIVKVSIQYEDLKTDVTEEQPAYAWLTLLADLGGALGLGMGACLVTVIQFLDVLLTIIGRAFKPSKKLAPVHSLNTERLETTKSTADSRMDDTKLGFSKTGANLSSDYRLPEKNLLYF